MYSYSLSLYAKHTPAYLTNGNDYRICIAHRVCYHGISVVGIIEYVLYNNIRAPHVHVHVAYKNQACMCPHRNSIKHPPDVNTISAHNFQIQET